MNCKIIITALFMFGTAWAFGQTHNGSKPQLSVMSVADTSVAGKKVIRKKPELMEADTTTKKSPSPVSLINEPNPVLAPSGISKDDKYKNPK